MPDAPKRNFEKLVVSVAANRISEDFKNEYNKCKKVDDPVVITISRIIRRMVKKKAHTYHISPTMKDMCDSLDKYGVIYKLNGTKVHFERKVKKAGLDARKLINIQPLFLVGQELLAQIQQERSYAT